LPGKLITIELKQTNKDILLFFHDTDSDEVAFLFSDTEYEVFEEIEDNWLTGTTSTWKLKIKANPLVCKTIEFLPNFDKERILKAFKTIDKSINQNTNSIIFIEDSDVNIAPKLDLLCNLIKLKSLLIRIATGLDRIQDMNDEYFLTKRQSERLISSFDIDFKLEFNDLWIWYHFYKEKYGSYHERRNYVNELFNPIIKTLVTKREISRDEIPLTGWERVDRVLSKARGLLDLGKNEEDFQQIGLYCREVFITLGQILYKPEQHKLIDDVNPSQTDSKRLLEIYVENDLQGKSKSALRKYLRSAIDLSNDLQHKRTANMTDANICLEATYSVTNTIKIIEEENKYRPQ
jgi:hypothetical protein